MTRKDAIVGSFLEEIATFQETLTESLQKGNAVTGVETQSADVT